MSLRVKVELVLFVVVALIVGLSYGIQRILVLPGLNPLEEKVAQEDMMGSIEAIHASVAKINALCLDRAAGANAIKIARDGSNESSVNGFELADLINDGLNAAYIIDNAGILVCGQSIDKQTNTEIQIQEFPAKEWGTSHVLLSRRVPGLAIRGIYMTEDGPMVVASNPYQGS